MVGRKDRVGWWLMGLFVLLMPTQFGRHFWPEWSYVLGIRVDYLSPTIYLTDVVWLLMFLLSFKEKRKLSLTFGLGMVLMMVMVNVVFAKNREVAVYRWIRWGQWWWTVNWFWEKRGWLKNILIKVLPGWIILETVLGVAQLVKGGSLEGWWYFLGERRFSFVTAGIAQMSILGRGLIRAYGTFSHPNSMAGFLLVCLLLWLRWKKQNGGTWWWVCWWMGVVGIVVSGSRSIWILTAGVAVWQFYKGQRRKKEALGMIMVLIGLFSIMLALVGVNYRTSDFLGGWDRESLEKRINLSLASVKMTKSSPLFGIGMGNFLVELPYYQKQGRYFWLQPVHNVLLLTLAEVGMLGLAGLAAGLSQVWEKRKLSKNDWLLVAAILLTGMVDHYWVTLPQNWWLMAIVVGLWGLRKTNKEVMK